MLKLHFCAYLPLLMLAGLVAAVPSSFAQPKKKGTNYAFLVACAGYNKAELQPIKDDVTINDILEFKKALLETGFAEENIVMMHDKQTDRRYFSEHDKILKELDLFLDGLKPEDTVLVVLSGHGVLFKGDKTGYFCPVDAKISAKEKLIPMDGEKGLYGQLEKCKAGRKLLIANACRNDPASAGANLAGSKIELADDYPEAVPKGIAAIYSCDAGQKSYFDTDRKRSLFFIHLTDAWRGKYHNGEGNLTLESVFDQTRVKTKADANKTFGEKQFPVVRRGYEGDWAIGVVKSGDITKDAKTYTSKTTGMKFVRIKAGTFMMGSPADEGSKNEKPQRKVTLTKDYYLGIYEVTRGQFKAFVDDTGYKTEGETDGKVNYGWDATKKNFENDPKFTWRNPGFVQTDEHPVVLVSWNDAVKFCDWLSKKDGKQYRLPSEAEWEHACRAGTMSRFHFGNDETDVILYANIADKDFRESTGKKSPDNGADGYGFTAPVGRFKPNAWGLYDMHGNVQEWCLDYYGPYDKVEEKADPVQLNKQIPSGSRVFRGGSWHLWSESSRAACRYGNPPYSRYYCDGFRVCRPLD